MLQKVCTDQKKRNDRALGVFIGMDLHAVYDDSLPCGEIVLPFVDRDVRIAFYNAINFDIAVQVCGVSDRLVFFGVEIGGEVA